MVWSHAPISDGKKLIASFHLVEKDTSLLNASKKFLLFLINMYKIYNINFKYDFNIFFLYDTLIIFQVLRSYVVSNLMIIYKTIEFQRLVVRWKSGIVLFCAFCNRTKNRPKFARPRFMIWPTTEIYLGNAAFVTPSKPLKTDGRAKFCSIRKKFENRFNV
jgi:hypothetical protein